MLVDFNHPQAAVSVFVQNRLDGGGFARARVAIEQHVVRRAPRHERFRVLSKLLLLRLVANQVGEQDRINVVDGVERKRAVFILLNAECPVQAEHAHAAVTVMRRHEVENLVLVLCARDGGGQRPNLLRHRAVVHLRLFRDGGVILQYGEAVDAQILLDGCEIEVKQALENGKIRLGEVVDAAVACADPLTGQREAVLVHHQHERQVVMPQIAVEAVARR